MTDYQRRTIGETRQGWGLVASESDNYVGNTTGTVGYTYSENSGSQNNDRLIGMTYPNGRILTYAYAAGIDSDISRVTGLQDAGGTDAGGYLEQYVYLGLNSIVARIQPGATMELSYIQQSGDTHYIADGGDRYTGLDRFGRVSDQYWFNTSTSATVDRLQYGYDRDGNVLYENNRVNSAFSRLFHANSSATGDKQHGVRSAEPADGDAGGNAEGIKGIRTLFAGVSRRRYARLHAQDCPNRTRWNDLPLPQSRK